MTYCAGTVCLDPSSQNSGSYIALVTVSANDYIQTGLPLNKLNNALSGHKENIFVSSAGQGSSVTIYNISNLLTWKLGENASNVASVLCHKLTYTLFYLRW